MIPNLNNKKYNCSNYTHQRVSNAKIIRRIITENSKNYNACNTTVLTLYKRRGEFFEIKKQ